MQTGKKERSTKRSGPELIAQVGLEGTFRPDELDVGTVLQHLLLLLELQVVLLVDIGEAPLLGDDDLLTTGELVTGTAESLDDNGGVGVFCPDGEDDLTDVYTGDGAVGLAPCTTHTGLQPISTGTGQHLVDADDMEGVGADTKVEGVFAGCLGDVLVGANTGGFEGFRRELLILVGDKVGAEGELVDVGTFTTEIKNTDLGVGHTTVVPRFRVRLVLAVAVAASGTATHCCLFISDGGF